MNSRTKALNESAILVALATILSIIKIIDLPYGGSVTLASMVPIVIISYRHGVGYGLGAGLVFGILQQLLGLKTLSYVTTWQSIAAVIMLDYILAFAVFGLAGVFRKAIKKQSVALAVGTLFVCLLRYVMHVMSGATVWAGISIPTKAALIYSVGYNATYMIPEAVIAVLVAAYIGEALDFRVENPIRLNRKDSKDGNRIMTRIVPGLILVSAFIADVVLIFSKLQNSETGEFDFSLLSDVNWTSVIVVTVTAIAASLLIVLTAKKKSNEEK